MVLIPMMPLQQRESGCYICGETKSKRRRMKEARRRANTLRNINNYKYLHAKHEESRADFDEDMIGPVNNHYTERRQASLFQEGGEIKLHTTEENSKMYSDVNPILDEGTVTSTRGNVQ